MHQNFKKLCIIYLRGMISMFWFKKKDYLKSDISKQIISNETSMRNNKIRGSLIGGAIGDALGYQIEFKKNIKEKEITNFNDGLGIISDDTQMTLFTANALLFRETRGAMRGIALLPVDAVYEAYLDWLDKYMGCHKNNV